MFYVLFSPFKFYPKAPVTSGRFAGKSREVEQLPFADSQDTRKQTSPPLFHFIGNQRIE